MITPECLIGSVRLVIDITQDLSSAEIFEKKRWTRPFIYILRWSRCQINGEITGWLHAYLWRVGVEGDMRLQWEEIRGDMAVGQSEMV